MPSTTPAVLSTAHASSVLNADHGLIMAWMAAHLTALSTLIRSDDTLVDQAVRERNLHPEVITALRAGLGSAAIAVPADLSVVTAKLAELAVTTAKIANAAVTTGKLADASVTTAKVIDAAITTLKLADLAVTTAKLAANAITNAKLAKMSPATIKGNNSLVTDQDPRDMSPAELNEIMPLFIPGSGTVGNKGLVPAPGAGDAAARKVLCADATWIVQAPVLIYIDAVHAAHVWR